MCGAAAIGGLHSGGCEREAEEAGLVVRTVGVMQGFGAGEGCDWGWRQEDKPDS